MSAPVTIFYASSQTNSAYLDGIAEAQEFVAGVPLALRVNETANNPFRAPLIPITNQLSDPQYPFVFYDQFRQVLASSTTDLTAIDFVVTYIDRQGNLQVTNPQQGPGSTTVAWVDNDGNPLLAQSIVSIVSLAPSPPNQFINIGWGGTGSTNYILMDYMRRVWNTTVEVYLPTDPAVDWNYTIMGSNMRISNPQTNGTVAPPPYFIGFPLGTVNATQSQRIEISMTTASLWIEVTDTNADLTASTAEFYATFLQQGVV